MTILQILKQGYIIQGKCGTLQKSRYQGLVAICNLDGEESETYFKFNNQGLNEGLKHINRPNAFERSVNEMIFTGTNEKYTHFSGSDIILNENT